MPIRASEKPTGPNIFFFGCLHSIIIHYNRTWCSRGDITIVQMTLKLRYENSSCKNVGGKLKLSVKFRYSVTNGVRKLQWVTKIIFQDENIIYLNSFFMFVVIRIRGTPADWTILRHNLIFKYYYRF